LLVHMWLKLLQVFSACGSAGGCLSVRITVLCFWFRAKISALALLKMAMHAKSGGNLEIMGMLQGKVQGDTFIVVDAFALPVEGTETRVNAQSEANEYMVEFQDAIKVNALPICFTCHIA
jgi:hypothetical protein